MKYFVRLLLTLVVGIVSFGVAFMANFGACYGNSSSNYCNGSGEAITTFGIPVIVSVASWLLIAQLQKSQALKSNPAAPRPTAVTISAANQHAKIKRQNILLIFSYLALVVGIILQTIGVYIIFRPVFIALVLAIIAITLTQSNRRNVILASIVIVIGVIFGLSTFGRF